MDKIVKNVKRKVEERLFISFEELSDKQKERLINTEIILSKYEDRQLSILEEIEKLKLNKVKISELISISRKTLYNDVVLNKYIEVYLEDEKRRLSRYESKNMKIREEYRELENRYNKLLCNIIEVNLIREENEYLKRSVESLTRQNEELRVLLYSNNKVIGIAEKKR